MITEQQVESALDYMRDKAQELAQAKSERVYLEQFRKSKKALLMKQVEGPEHVRATHAYSHPEYLELLEGLSAAIEHEELVKWRMRAAELKIEVWRTQQANSRRVDNSHR